MTPVEPVTGLSPRRIETERLVVVRLGETDLWEPWGSFDSPGRRERATRHVPWFERYDPDAYHATCHADDSRPRRPIRGYVDDYGERREGSLRHHSTRPDGSVTDQYRFSITREERETATADDPTPRCTVELQSGTTRHPDHNTEVAARPRSDR
ncbi:hypothetical protein [Halobaculum sp. MBLA0143]|uniref:hypothetical protein n=1 Tax=Halobaculum sp. MBLA0143 TaxID=3079933 RepID=UPI003526BD29